MDGAGRLVDRRALLAGAGGSLLGALCLAGPLVYGLRAGGAPPAGEAVRGPVSTGGRLVGAPAPPLAGHGPAGGLVDIADLRGHVVVVNAWASWCQPCRREMPLLLDAVRRWRASGLRLVGLNTGDRPEHAVRFLREVGVPGLATVHDPDRRHAHAWGVRGLPETFVVDRDATVAAHHAGEADRQWLYQVLERLLPAGGGAAASSGNRGGGHA